MRIYGVRALVFCLFLASLCHPSDLVAAALPGEEALHDFSFKGEQTQAIFAHIAKVGRFSVVVAPEIACDKMAVSLKQVAPLDALFLVARIQGLRVRRDPVAWQTGSIRYTITKPQNTDRSYQYGNTRTIQLRGCEASVVREALLERLGKGANIGIEVDKRANRILLLAPEELMSRATNIVFETERAATAPPASAATTVIQRHPPADSFIDVDLSGI